MSDSDLPGDSMADSMAADLAKSPPAPDQPNAHERVAITAGDLPLHCPMPGKRLWDSHPRVYLPIKPGGAETCPYCGTRYVFAVAPVDSADSN